MTALPRKRSKLSRNSRRTISKGSPIEAEYKKLSATPDDFPKFVQRIVATASKAHDFGADKLKATATPMFFFHGDADGVRLAHVAEKFRLKGGDIHGDIKPRSASRLAILPKTTHVTLMQRMPLPYESAVESEQVSQSVPADPVRRLPHSNGQDITPVRLPLAPTSSAALLVLAFLASPAVACNSEPRPDTVRSAPPPAVVSLAAFSSLAWIFGRWEGTGGDAPFYEAYRSLNDSTIRMYSFGAPSDSAVQDSSFIQLRAGTVTSGTAQMQWVVTALDSTHVAFAPGRGAANAFEWHRVTPNEWTARLTWDSAGVPRERRYVMRRRP